MAIDYRSILKKYIEHVLRYEGSHFIGECYDDLGGCTNEELAELKSIADEVEREYQEWRTSLG